MQLILDCCGPVNLALMGILATSMLLIIAMLVFVVRQPSLVFAALPMSSLPVAVGVIASLSSMSRAMNVALQDASSDVASFLLIAIVPMTAGVVASFPAIALGAVGGFVLAYRRANVKMQNPKPDRSDRSTKFVEPSPKRDAAAAEEYLERLVRSRS